MAHLVIAGNSEIARIAFEYFKHDSNMEVVAFTVDRAFIETPEFCGLPVVAFDEVAAHLPPGTHQMFVAVGSGRLNRVRTEMVQRAIDAGYELASYISSRAFIWHDVEIGRNCFILENNVLQSGVRIGDNVTLWSGNHIGHGTVVEDNVFISSHVVLSGFTHVGKNTFMGVNAATAEHTVLAEDNFVAMGAAVTKSTAPDQLLVGNPAEPQKVGAKRFSKVRG